MKRYFGRSCSALPIEMSDSGTLGASATPKTGSRNPERSYQMCTRTVMDTTDPEITFDDEGISNHWYEYRDLCETRLPTPECAERERARLVQLMRAAGRGKAYDCVLGLSGGVDSSYLAHLAVQLGLRPLVVHFDNGWNSELAVHNIELLVKGLHLDLQTFVMDWPEFRDLQRAYFKASVVDLEVPTDHMILGALYQITRQHGLKFILSGTNIVTEAILPRRWYFPKFDLVNLRDIHKHYGTLPVRKLPALGFWQMTYYSRLRGIKSVELLNLIEYDKHAAKALLTERYGWRDYGGKHYESVFTRFYQGYILPHKFNIDKRKAHLSNLICSGQMTRAEALEELRLEPYPVALQVEDKRYVAKKLGFSEAEFDEILRLPNRRHEEFATDARLRRRYFRVMSALKPVTSRLKKLRRGSR
jgi:N-acetyl sugar amidotransferase